MKHISALLILAILCIYACDEKKSSSSVKTDEIPSANPSAEITSVADIRMAYTQIENELRNKLLREKVQEFVCENQDGSGTLSRYFNENGELVYMQHVQGIGHYSKVQKFYFKQGKLFFIHEIEESWKPIDMNSEGEMLTAADIDEKRTYLVNNKIIDQLQKSYSKSDIDTVNNSDLAPNIQIKANLNQTYTQMQQVQQWMSGDTAC